MTNGSYVEVRIEVDAPLNDELAGMLSLLGFEGFWEEEHLLKCYIRSERWNPFIMDEIRSTTRLLLHPSGESFPQITVHTVPRVDWNAEWESTLRPLQVTDRMIIAPSWNPPPQVPGTIVLTIDPKMSFGTGYHESTRLILRLVEEFVAPGSTFLDVGTGTGVLAIAAVRLGAASAVAMDVDSWSYENALENCRLNGVGSSVTVRRGTISDLPDTAFDIVAANIQRSIIEPALPEMLRHLAPAGVLLLAGLLNEDRDAIRTAFQLHGLNCVRELHENEWIAMAARF